MQLRTKRVTWSNIAITVREETGLDTFKEPQLYWRIVEAIHGDGINYSSQLETSENLRINGLVVMLSRTTQIEGDLGFEWPHIDCQKEALIMAYHSLETMPGGLVRKWHKTIMEVSIEPMGDPDLAPPEHLSTKKKETQKSEENEVSLENT